MSVGSGRPRGSGRAHDRGYVIINTAGLPLSRKAAIPGLSGAGHKDYITWLSAVVLRLVACPIHLAYKEHGHALAHQRID